MTTPITTYIDPSGADFVELLREHGIIFERNRAPAPDGVSDVIALIQAIGSLSFFPSLATVLIAWLRRHKDRKVTLRQSDNSIVHVVGYGEKELAKLLQATNTITVRVIDAAITEQERSS